MSYIINDGAEQARPRRRRLLLVMGALTVVVLGVLAFLLGRAGSAGPGAAPFAGLGAPPITWSQVGGQPVPTSPLHGPRQVTAGLAAGFAHDELGAVLAAINISTRLSRGSGPAVYETTLRQQCVGDIEATLSAIRKQTSTAVAGSAVPTEYLYRITGGAPTSDVVIISIAGRTPQGTTAGGFGEVTRTMQWVDGDWRLQVPPSPPRLIPSVTDYMSLGRINA